MSEFNPPPFLPHRWIRGGHLQTIFSVRSGCASAPADRQHKIDLPDGDAIILHENCREDWSAGDPSLLLLHGLAGCHLSPYMIRLADRFSKQGVRVFRMDSRGCGAGAAHAVQLVHAGRSDDVIAALTFIAELTEGGNIAASGVSLGANQLLRAVGRIGAGIDQRPEWFDRLHKVAAVAPPCDLTRCSDNFGRLLLRPYNFYFIRNLLGRVPELVKDREDFQQAIQGPRPRTLRELDQNITAPLSGFSGANEYYEKSSACKVMQHIDKPTLLLVSEDDPMVPVGCFTDSDVQLAEQTELVVSKGGGHVGFISRDGSCWMDDVLDLWFKFS